MKQHKSKTYAGVWLDTQQAMIISKNDDNEQGDFAILEKVKAKAAHGSGSEHTINNAKHADTIKYFKSVSSLLLDYDEILVFGPGKSQEQFQNILKEDVQFKSKKISIDSAEHLTDPQMIAKVRDFFKSN